MLPELVVAWLALAAPVAAERCMGTHPAETPLPVRRFDGKVIVALHNGENDGILRASADRIGKPSAYVAERQTLGLSGVHHLLLKRTRVAGGAASDISVSRSDLDIDRQVQLDETGLKQRHGQVIVQFNPGVGVARRPPKLLEDDLAGLPKR